MIARWEAIDMEWKKSYDFAHMLKGLLWLPCCGCGINDKGRNRDTMLKSVWWWMVNVGRVLVLNVETSNCILDKLSLRGAKYWTWGLKQNKENTKTKQTKHRDQRWFQMFYPEQLDQEWKYQSLLKWNDNLKIEFKIYIVTICSC